MIGTIRVLIGTIKIKKSKLKIYACNIYEATSFKKIHSNIITLGRSSSNLDEKVILALKKNVPH